MPAKPDYQCLIEQRRWIKIEAVPEPVQVAVITINTGHKANALTPAVLAEIKSKLDDLATEPETGR